MSLPVLVVFSHLRWGFVYQRPQHLLSRLRKNWRILFIEEPVHEKGDPYMEIREPLPGLKVLTPHTSVQAPGFHDDQLTVLEPLVTDCLREENVEEAVVWLYTPMALPLVKTVRARCTIYDCMDDLASFKDAPRQLRQRENALMKHAELVLTGGPSLYEAKRGANDNVHCIPSSVDAAHYDPVRLDLDSEEAYAAQALQGALPRPRLGYFGVIDERLDLGLVAALADARPDWQIVMAGPVVKIDPASLPQRPNLHWLGMQPYERLPHLLAGWDVCLMPFALNEATRHISPTKTLEYLAGEKPVVSTPVRDVVLLYGSVVRIAEGAGAFISACEEWLAEVLPDRCQRMMETLALVSTHSWDRSAQTVDELIQAAVAKKESATPLATQAGDDGDFDSEDGEQVLPRKAAHA